MKRFLYAGGFLALIAVAAILQQTRAVGQTPAQSSLASDPHGKMLNTYCVGCHNSRVKTGGVAFDAMDLSNPGHDADIWEKALRKLRGRQMPPPGIPQPPQKDIDEFMAWMEAQLDANTGRPTAGFVPIQRLNRTEYAAAVEALIGVSVDEKEVLPQDIAVEGFDNVAEALNVSPAFLDQYLTAARHLAKRAVGDPHPRMANVPYKISENSDPEVPLPLGTRGGVGFKHNFPADGDYQINIVDVGAAQALYTGPLESRVTVVVLVDNKIVFKGDVGGPEDLALGERKAGAGRDAITNRFQKIPFHANAGERNVVVAFIDRSHVESDENVAGGFGGRARMVNLAENIEVVGPFNPTGVSMTASRKLIFVCDPQQIGEAACARQIMANLARRAYRRPVTDEDIDQLVPFYNLGRENGGSFDQGIEQVVAGVLSSPEFLYRAIRGAPGVSHNQEYPLTDLELASRLSFFLWNTGPDDELLKLAAANQLSQPGALEAQVRRMMDDRKASSLVTSFAMKWLNLDTLDLVEPDPMLFRGFNAQMRKDMVREVQEFLSSILLENRSVLEVLSSDETFLNDRLARHYGISDGPTTSQFRRFTLTDPARFGILGKAAVLMRTSYADRTSPVLRGAWVLDKLMGTPPAPPPPTVASNLNAKEGDPPRTVRERLELHRDNPTCKMCHGVIDPTGLALENFNVIGQFRTVDPQAENAKIDASTVLPNGVAIDGPAELRTELAAHPEMFVRALTEKLLMYAVNRPLEYFDMPQVRQVVRDSKKDNYTLMSLVLGIVNTDAFRKQGVPSHSKAAPQEGAATTAQAKVN